jgi:isopentenyl diphosphate isomerase/L-lactate dehydrogenase-like FMN-dependent dehydrogenase
VRASPRYTPPFGPPIDLGTVVTVRDFEAPARERLHPSAVAYYAGGSWDEVTVVENVTAWRRFTLLPRVLIDVSPVDLTTTVLGHRVASPFGIAPTALQGLAHPEGEVATARAAAEAGVLNVISTLASRPLEDVALAAPDGPRWFQLYVGDRDQARSLVERAAANGYTAIVLTVDLPVVGYRGLERRVRFDPGVGAYGNIAGSNAASGSLDAMLGGARLTWGDLTAIRSWSSLPLVVKGILTPEDAILSVEHGAHAVWVSNHGGRQLDRVPTAIDALEPIADAVAGRAEVYMDGGVRRGTDVVTALGLGATAVFAGRPILYALACAGEAGVAHALRILREETELALALLGVVRPAEVTRAHVGRAPR